MSDTVEIHCKNQSNEELKYSIKDINPNASDTAVKNWVQMVNENLTTNSLVKVLRIKTTEI